MVRFERTLFMMEHLPEFIVHHWELCLALVIILILIAIYELRAYRIQSQQISPQHAVFLINNEKAAIFDARERIAFEKGHILDAVHVAIDSPNATALQKYKKLPVILVCEQGKITPIHASKWVEAGFTQLTILAGGIAAWKEAGFPLVNHKDIHEQKN